MFLNYVFKGKRDIPNVYGFGPFLGPIYPPENLKYGQQPKFSQKLHP